MVRIVLITPVVPKNVLHNCEFTDLHIMASVCVCVSAVCRKISLLQLGALNSGKNDE